MTPHRSRRRGARGQSVVEAALLIPLIILIALGATDLAQAFRFDSDVAGASRAGMRLAIQADATDIGDAVRSEPNTVVADTPTDWGDTAAGGANGDCTSATPHCGDPNGCPSSVFTGTRVACFAVRSCILDSQFHCYRYSAWNTRPTPYKGFGDGIEVVTIYKFSPKTPLIAQLTGSGGSFYLKGATQGLELYY